MSLHELEKRAAEAEKALKEVQKDFDEYKEEKHKNDEIVNKQLSDAKAELNEAR
jgi:dsDNA-specific endonuclease/ATPase MutS2